MGELKSEPTLKTHLEPSRGRAGLTEVRGAQGGGEAGVGSRFGLGIEVWGWGRIDHISKCYGPLVLHCEHIVLVSRKLETRKLLNLAD